MKKYLVLAAIAMLSACGGKVHGDQADQQKFDAAAASTPAPAATIAIPQDQTDEGEQIQCTNNATGKQQTIGPFYQAEFSEPSLWMLYNDKHEILGSVDSTDSTCVIQDFQPKS
jgi:hypothetical protein